MRKKGIAVTNEELVNLIAREYGRKDAAMARFAVAGEGVCSVVNGKDELDTRKLRKLSDSRLKGIYKRLTGRNYE